MQKGNEDEEDADGDDHYDNSDEEGDDNCDCDVDDYDNDPALQLHFIKCPFPNQIQFGLGKNPQIIDQLFQTKSSLVWKIIVSNLEGN